jgi:exopolysaccharide production protein ExoQ
MSEFVASLRLPSAAAPLKSRAGLFRDIFTAAYLLMLCGALYSVFSTAAPNGALMAKAGTSSSYTAVWLALYGLLVFHLRQELSNPVNLIAQNRWFALFVASAILSYVFAPPSSQLVATKLFMFVMTLLFGMYLAKNYTVGRLLSLFITVSAVVLIVHWLIYPMQSHFTYDRMARATLLGIKPYGGLFGHKNLAGLFFGLSVLACYGRALVAPKRLRYVALAFGHGVALVGAGAAGALLCAGLGALVMTAFFLKTRRSRWTPFFVLGIAIAVVAVIGMGTNSILHAVGRDASMSGRSRLFAVWPNYFWQHPLFGWGYANFFTGVWNEPAVELRTLTPYHARYFTFESGYLEMAIDFGIVGAGLFFAMMTTGFRNAYRLAVRTDVVFAQVPIGWLVFIAVMSISDSGLRIHNLVTASLVAWTYFGLRTRRRRGTAQQVQTWRPIWTPS